MISSSRARWLPDTLGVLWVVVAAGAVLAPALAHGSALGPFDLLSRQGLTTQPGVAIHNAQTTDLITEMIPWADLSWIEVHHGHIPLWNPYSALGMPLLFNWQSGGFSVPSLLGYLFPERLAYTVQVFATLVVSGTGVYVLGRVLRLGVLASATAGVVFELCGPMIGFSGWPIAGVMSWAGWLFAAAILVLEGRRRVASAVLFAVVLACAVFAGQPGTLALLVMSLIVFVVVTAAVRAFKSKTPSVLVRPMITLSVAGVVGAALAAPLLLPGAQLLRTAEFRVVGRVNTAIPLQDAVQFMLQGFDGQSLARSPFFDVATTTYVGVIALVLAVAGLVVYRRRPETVGLAALAVVMAAVLYLPPVLTLLNKLPFRPRWHIGAVTIDMAIAVLAAMGMDALVRWRGESQLVSVLGWGFGAAGFVLAMMWVLGRGNLPPASAHIRDESFAWPAAEVVLGLTVVTVLAILSRRTAERTERDGARRGRICFVLAGSLLACETAFLIAVGTGVWSSSPSFFPQTPAVGALQRAVGSSVVGFGARSCQSPPTLGILQEANIAYGVREFAAYDPVTPSEYFRSWMAASGQSARAGVPPGVFCPVVSSVALGRLFGVSFVLVPEGAAGPPGSELDARIGNEELYRIPGVSQATLTPLSASGRLPGMWAGGSPVRVERAGATSTTMKVVVDSKAPSALRIRLPDVPGWQATIDGRPLTLTRFAGLMLQARIPPGRHSVELRYLPATFSVGVALSVSALVVLTAALVASWLTMRSGRRQLRRRVRQGRREPPTTRSPANADMTAN